MPAKAGIQGPQAPPFDSWIPAFAGMTVGEGGADRVGPPLLLRVAAQALLRALGDVEVAGGVDRHAFAEARLRCRRRVGHVEAHDAVLGAADAYALAARRVGAA